MTGFDVSRVAQVVATRSDGYTDSTHRGSGYRITSDTVLTAWHVVTDALDVVVTFDPGRPGAQRRAAEPTWHCATCDAALLTIEGSLGGVEPATFGRLSDRSTVIEVQTAGFPLWKIRTGDDGRPYRDLADEHGTVSVLANRRSGTLEIQVHLPDDPDPRQSPWAAMSGAAVWAGQHIIGFVADHHRDEGVGTLTGRRLDRCFEHSATDPACRFAAALGISDPDALPDVLPADSAANGRPASAVRPREPIGLRTHRLPLGWRPGDGPCPVTDRYAADLGAWLCLDRRPGTSVVAGCHDLPLAEALTDVERGSVGLGIARRVDLPPRTWRLLAADAAATAVPVQAAAGTAVGVVLDWPVDETGRGLSRLPVRAAHERVRTACPEASVAVLVHADRPFIALSSATDVGRTLAAGLPPRPVEVFAHIDPRTAARPAGNAPEDPPAAVAARLLATVPAQLRSLVAVPGHLFADRALTDDVDPDAVADAVVTALEQDVWGPPVTEARALGLIRDHAPRFFRALLRRHAARRSGPARWASLAASAEIDNHVDEWLGAGGSRPVLPSALPRALRDARTIEAVLLGVVRNGLPGVEAWSEAARGRCPAAVAVVDHLRSGADNAEFFQRASAEEGVAAARAGADTVLMSQLPEPGTSAAWWAVLGRSPLEERSVVTLAGLSDEMRDVAGLTARPSAGDPFFADQIGQLRSAMRPPLPLWRDH